MQACKRLHLIGTLSYSGFRTIFTLSNCSVIKQICSGVCIPTHVANIAGIDAMFVIKFHSTSLPATYKSISGVRVLFCAIPSHLVLTFATVFCLPLRRLLCPFPPGSCCPFCLRFKFHSNRSFHLYHQLCRTGIMIMILGIVAVTMKSEICNGSPSLQSALWQSESCSVKERERILHRLHCAKAGLSVWCLWPSLSLPPPLQCSAVQCTSACQCCTNGLGAAKGSFSRIAC